MTHFNNNATRQTALKTLTYHNDIFDRCAVTVTCSTNRTLILSEDQATVPFGSFDFLPPELLDLILERLTLAGILTLRMVNKRARVYVDNSGAFKHIRLHAMQMLGALVALDVASHFTVRNLADALLSAVCSVCGEHGDFLWILECRRCCYNCMRTSPKLRPASLALASIYYGMSFELIEASLPVIMLQKGIYGPRAMKNNMIIPILSRRLVHELALDVHGGPEGLDTHLKHSPVRMQSNYESDTIDRIPKTLRFQSAVRLPNCDPNTQTRYFGLSCRGCELTSREEVVPKWDSGLTEISPGYAPKRILARDRTYTVEGYLRHFQTCAASQKLWQEFVSRNPQFK